MNLQTYQNQTSHPGEKDKIYIGYHPADQEKAARIRQQILLIHDCIIYEEDLEHTIEQEGRALALGQMQLLIFVITKRFLTEDNMARMVDFAEAKKAHARILPIVAEPGVEEAFDRICGSFHLLNGRSPDFPAEIRQYLAQYLEDAKVWDPERNVYVKYDRRKRMQECFSARIFLSYRKKDYRQALRLITRIHRDPQFEDADIWFDHFLTPGEEYNEEIQENLEKSDLFLLLITPSLLEEGNYVMTTEYPRAMALGKTILPVIMEQTDLLSLMKAYPGLPAPINEDLGKELEKHLANALAEKGLRTGRISYQNLFTLAKGYMDGICVEKDVPHGTLLLERAAKEGNPDAATELAELLLEDDRNTADAIYFLKLACREYARICRMEDAGDIPGNPLETGTRYGKTLDQLFRLQKLTEDYDGAYETLQDLLQITRRNAALGAMSATSNPGLVYMHMGELCYIREDYEKAEECYAQAYDIMEPLYRGGADWGVFRFGELMRNMRLLYQNILVNTGRTDLLKPAIGYGYKAMQAFLEICHRKHAHYEQVETEAFSLAGLAAGCEKVDMVSARKLHREVRAVYEELYDIAPSYTVAKGLALEYLALGELGDEETPREQQIAALEQALELFQRLREMNPEDAEVARYIQIALHDLGR
ncbi:MAG: TIR domain-containing protein [Lachnospiraceae bacterium]|nr:TIR domain-containing protein [Lachnospiraceae bacterium]